MPAYKIFGKVVVSMGIRGKAGWPLARVTAAGVASAAAVPRDVAAAPAMPDLHGIPGVPRHGSGALRSGRADARDPPGLFHWPHKSRC